MRSFSAFWRSFPVRTSFWILLLFSSVFYWILFKAPAPSGPESDATNTVLPLVQVLLQLGLILLVASLVIALLTTLLAWVWHRRKATAGTVTLVLQPAEDQQQGFELQFSAPPVPFWGSRQVQLLFTNGEATPLLPVAFRNGFDASQRTQTATGMLQLEHIERYQLQAVRYWFKDVFGLLALHTDVPASAVTFRNPDALDGVSLSALPRQAQELNQRTDTMQRVEGDLYNSRRFSTGDDMRRILWPVYARTGELMVRIPEIFEPYASTLTVFASFNAQFPMGFSDNSDASRTSLDFYKNAVWTLYQNLRLNGADVRLRLPQTAFVPEGTNPSDALRYQLSASTWQSEEPQPDSRTGLWVISSLVPIDWLQDRLDSFSGTQQVVLVQLSAAFDEARKRSILSKVLFRLPQAKAQQQAQLSTRLFRQQLQAREEQLLTLLGRYDVLAGTIPASTDR